MIALFWLVDRLLSLYMWAVILAAVFSILTSFGVLDTRNRIVWTIGDFLYRITEPALRPIRKMLPNLGGIDISPLILILLLQAARMLLGEIEGQPGAEHLLSDFWRPLPDGVAVAVKVQPKSRRPGLHGAAPAADGERLRIGVTEAAEGGRANRAACAALAAALGTGTIRRPSRRSAPPAGRRRCTSPAIPPLLGAKLAAL